MMWGLRRATVQRIVAVVTALLMVSSLSTACRWPTNPWPGGTHPATRLRAGLTQAEVAAVLADAWYHAECDRGHLYTNPPAEMLEEIYLYGPKNQQQVGVVQVIYRGVSLDYTGSAVSGDLTNSKAAKTAAMPGLPSTGTACPPGSSSRANALRDLLPVAGFPSAD
jgi:hypothetical protein